MTSNPILESDADYEEDPTSLARHREAIREGRRVAIRCALCWTPLAAAIVIGGLWLLSNAFIAADELLRDKAEFWYEATMPVVILAMIGMVFGAVFGWRITATSGLAGRPAWWIGLTSIVAVMGLGLLGALFIYTNGIPMLVWIGIGVMGIIALVAVSFFSLWGR